ncbi:hypothetical protein YC2023_096712 [Brassica napus]
MEEGDHEIYGTRRATQKPRFPTMTSDDYLSSIQEQSFCGETEWWLLKDREGSGRTSHFKKRQLISASIFVVVVVVLTSTQSISHYIIRRRQKQEKPDLSNFISLLETLIVTLQSQGPMYLISQVLLHHCLAPSLFRLHALKQRAMHLANKSDTVIWKFIASKDLGAAELVSCQVRNL